MSRAHLPEPYASLARRFGREKLEQRLLTQASHWAKLTHQGSGLFRFENKLPLDAFVAFALAATGLSRRGRVNHLAPRRVECSWEIPRLPPAFAGYRVLQLTDLHLDLDADFTDALIGLLQGVECDAIVITGDFRNSTRTDFMPSVNEARRLFATLPAVPRFGILGNHDFVEQLPHLEAAGLPMLLNEAAFVERDGQRLWFAGVDDPHFYKTHDLAAATAAIPADACTVLLAHSPEIADELRDARFDLVLCGHTHGGQLCLPGGRWLHVPIKNQPRERIRGAWKVAGTQGYTSVGTGSCGVPARLNCHGEYTLHTLWPAGVVRPA
jgi:predicted MPP superfamily phosphohydrolase